MPWGPAFWTRALGGVAPSPIRGTSRPDDMGAMWPGWGGEPGHMVACLVITGLAIRDLDIFWMPALESGNLTANTGW